MNAGIRYTETRHTVLAQIDAGTYRPGGLSVGAGKAKAVMYLVQHRFVHTNARMTPIGTTQDGRDQLTAWNAHYGTPGTCALGPLLTQDQHALLHKENSFEFRDCAFELRAFGAADVLKCSYCHRRVSA